VLVSAGREVQRQGEYQGRGELELFELVTLDTAYSNAIADEHYHREMFQNRLSYHTNVVLVALGAIVAGALEAEREWVFRLLGAAAVLVGGLAIATPFMLARIYRHFIEHLDVRERLEVAIGLRNVDALGDSEKLKKKMGDRPSPTPPASLPLPMGVIFNRSWIREGKEWGYFTWMKLLFRTVGLVAVLSGTALALAPDRLGVVARPESGAAVGTPAEQGLSRRLVGLVGAFAPGETCATTEGLESQVTQIVQQLSPTPRRLLFVGVADRRPVSGKVQDSFGNNVGIALSRARCVAGWVSERLAWDLQSAPVDIRVRDASIRSPSTRATGAPEDRLVEVFAYYPR
jgi:hypothetical protein